MVGVVEVEVSMVAMMGAAVLLLALALARCNAGSAGSHCRWLQAKRSARCAMPTSLYQALTLAVVAVAAAEVVEGRTAAHTLMGEEEEEEMVMGPRTVLTAPSSVSGMHAGAAGVALSTLFQCSESSSVSTARPKI
jgi:hypothetical protein